MRHQRIALFVDGDGEFTPQTRERAAQSSIETLAEINRLDPDEVEYETTIYISEDYHVILLKLTWYEEETFKKFDFPGFDPNKGVVSITTPDPNTYIFNNDIDTNVLADIGQEKDYDDLVSKAPTGNITDTFNTAILPDDDPRKQPEPFGPGIFSITDKEREALERKDNKGKYYG